MPKSKKNKTIDFHESYDFMVLSKKLSPKFLKQLRNSSPPIDKKIIKFNEFVSFGQQHKIAKSPELRDKNLTNTAFKE